MTTRTDRTSDFRIVVGNDTNRVDLGASAQSFTVTSGHQAATRRYVSENFTRSRPLYSDYAINFGNIDYNAQSKGLVGMQRQSTKRVVLANTRAGIGIFGDWVLAGEPITPAEDDLVMYDIELLQDGLWCVGAVGSAQAFEFTATVSEVSWSVPAGTYDENTEVFVVVDEPLTGVSLVVEDDTNSNNSNAVSLATQGVIQAGLPTGWKSNVSTATSMKLVASGTIGAQQSVSGVVVIASKTGV